MKRVAARHDGARTKPLRPLSLGLRPFPGVRGSAANLRENMRYVRKHDGSLRASGTGVHTGRVRLDSRRPMPFSGILTAGDERALREASQLSE